MLTLPISLPAGALLDHEGDMLAQALTGTGAHWFAAQPELMDGGMGSPVTRWQPAVGNRSAKPCDANTGNGAQSLHRNLPVMAFSTGVNGGFVAPNVASTAACFTLAVIYAAPVEEARTLATLSLGSGDDRNIFFLSQAEGMLVAKDRSGGISAELACGPLDARFHLVIASWDGDRLILTHDESRAESRGSLALSNTVVELFIGCRGHRKGLTKLLGAGLIGDVIFWPDQALLSARHPADPSQLAALLTYFRWHY
jgi:hypothetical protein